MSNYNSENTIVLATHVQAGNNTRMLLLHTCESGRLEYVVGSYFQQERYDGALGYEHVDYSWDWGHYFDDVVSAVNYWESEVLCKDSARRMVLDDAWKRFGDTPIDEEENIDEPFWMKPGKSYPAGTSRLEIWHDFDDLYAEWGGVHALMYPDEH